MREDRIAIALLALLVVAAFANVIFDGRSLVASDNLNPLWPDFSSPAEWRRPDLVGYPNYRDITSAIMQSDPSREFLRRSLLRGEFPFWDPYVGGGGPSFASMWPAYLFPPSLLVVLLGNGGVVKNAYILLLILCSGTLTYFFLRLHALRWPAALAGAIAFSFSGAVIQTSPSVIGQPVAFFSLPLLVTARLIDRPDARRAAQLALAFAFVALASFPPVLLQTFGMSVVYAIVAIVMKSKERARTAAWFAGAVAVSLAIASVVYLPGWKAMDEMSHVREYYSHAAQATMPASQFGQALSPTIMGGVAIYAHPAVMGSTGLHLYYSGVVALFLTGIGFVAGGGMAVRILRITASLCGALALAKTIGLPPVQWLAYVPILRNFHCAAYLGILVAYSTAILASLGLDALLGGRPRAWHVAVGASIPGLALLAVRIQAWRRGVAFQSEGWRWLADFRVLIVFCVLAVIAAWVAHRWPRVRTAAVVFVMVLLAAEGLRNSSYPRPRRGNVWAHPPRYVEVLAEKNSGGRVLPMPVYPANTESVFRQPTLDVILSASTRMYGLYKRYFGPIPDPILRDANQIPPERVLDVANIEYIAIASSDERHVAEAVQRGYEPLYVDALVHVMRRPADPRYSFTSSYQMARSESEALAALETLPRGSVLLEAPPSFPSAAGPTAEVQPRVTKFSLNDVELVVQTQRPGLLVCSESNMTGWTATIDRRPARILTANYAFRAIEIPRGAHTIRLSYYPPGLTGGLALAFLGLLACGWGLRSTLDNPQDNLTNASPTGA
ncbi:MAG TPA: YfhO family protein [Thermoanaerobaculia bacterium]|nr:YfhO family protein [Thermoanaerobaculia bacterium]